MRRTFRNLLASVLALALLAPGAWAAGGAAPSGGDSGSVAEQKYRKGRLYVEKGLAMEEELRGEPSDERRSRQRARARQQYRHAFGYFESAIEREPDYTEAHSDMGFVLRKLGDHPKALEAYDRALAIEPDYAPAIEYRAEAYLELGRLEDVKSSYLRLFDAERDLANLLMGKMKVWVARRRSEPAGLDPEAIADFGRWVEERAEIARRTASVGGGSAPRW